MRTVFETDIIIGQDRRVTLVLPPEVEAGRAHLLLLAPDSPPGGPSLRPTLEELSQRPVRRELRKRVSGWSIPPDALAQLTEEDLGDWENHPL